MTRKKIAPAPEAAPAQVPVIALAQRPRKGGSYIRDPQTDALTRAGTAPETQKQEG